MMMRKPLGLFGLGEMKMEESEIASRLAHMQSQLETQQTKIQKIEASLHARLARAMRKVTYIKKFQPKGMSYSVVSHDAVTSKVRPALLDEGVIYYPIDLQHRQEGNRTEVRLTVRFVNVDNPSDRIDVPALGYGVDNQDKGPGKAVSYAVKYALLKTLGLETGDDADLESIEHQAETREAIAAREAERLSESVAAIQDGISDYVELGSDEGLRSAAAAWGELTDDEKHTLWIAPTKMEKAGFEPIFTTREREIMKTSEFREAWEGKNSGI